MGLTTGKGDSTAFGEMYVQQLNYTAVACGSNVEYGYTFGPGNVLVK